MYEQVKGKINNMHFSQLQHINEEVLCIKGPNQTYRLESNANAEDDHVVIEGGG